MHLWSATRLPTAAIAWRAADRSLSLTAIGKATFRLEPGEAPLAATQEPIASEDVLDALGSLRVPGDLVPYKRRVDVLLVGSPFPPQPSTGCVTRLVVGPIDKAVEVHPGAAARAALEAFAPRGPSSAHRARLAGARGAQLQHGWYRQPLPGDVHPEYWSAAPVDQQADSLAEPIGIQLENLSPAARQLVTTLAPLHFSLYAEGGGITGSHPLRPDTLWIDTERQLVCVTYRATIPVEDGSDLRATILGDHAASQQDPVTLSVLGAASTIPPEDDEADHVPVATAFVQLTQAELDLVRGALPFRPAAREAPPAPALAPPPPVTSPPLTIAAPALAPPPVAVPALAPPPVAQTGRGPAPPPPARAFTEVQHARPALMHEAGGALAGVAGASDAAARAAGTAARRRRRWSDSGEERPRPASSDLCDLLWFDETVPTRIRRVEAWAPAVRDHAGDRTWLTSAESVQQSQTVKDRRAVTRALSRVTPTELSTLPRLLADSVDDDGFIDRSLLVVSGELSIPFDPADVLKVTVELATAMSPRDKPADKSGAAEKLREALDAANERSSGVLVDGLVGRIRQAFAQLNRALPADYLETTVHQTLLEERRYQVRDVLGGPHFLVRIQPGTGHPTPVYVPEAAGLHLPLLARFRARLVTEPHPQQHRADGEGPVLRALAIGRAVAQRPR